MIRADQGAIIFNFWVLFFTHKLEIEPVQATQDKIEKNAQKYPAELVRAKSAKYTEY